MTEMEQWNPLQVFAVTCAASALAGLAGYLRPGQAVTVRGCVQSFLYSGAFGAAVPMIGYEWLGGKEKPWRIIGVGMLIGLGVLGQVEIRSLVRRFLGTFSAGTGGKDDGNN